MKEREFKELLEELLQSKPEERIHRIREIWPELNQEQQDILEEFLERTRKRPQRRDVRKGQSETRASERREERSLETRPEPGPAPEPDNPEEAIYTREETTNEEEEGISQEAVERAYRTSRDEEPETLSLPEEERLEEEEYVSRRPEETGHRTRRDGLDTDQDMRHDSEMGTNFMRKEKRYKKKEK